MSLISRMRRQKAVLWQAIGKDRFGQLTYNTATEIDCRWEDKTQTFIDAEGQEATSSAIVYVDRELTPGDLLWKGEQSNLPTGYIASDIGTVVRRFDILPNLKNTENLLTVTL